MTRRRRPRGSAPGTPGGASRRRRCVAARLERVVGLVGSYGRRLGRRRRFWRSGRSCASRASTGRQVARAVRAARRCAVAPAGSEGGSRRAARPAGAGRRRGRLVVGSASSVSGGRAWRERDVRAEPGRSLGAFCGRRGASVRAWRPSRSRGRGGRAALAAPAARGRSTASLVRGRGSLAEPAAGRAASASPSAGVAAPCRRGEVPADQADQQHRRRVKNISGKRSISG